MIISRATTEGIAGTADQRMKVGERASDSFNPNTNNSSNLA